MHHAATPDPSPALLELPDRIGDYRIGREIGRGGMGCVVEATQLALGRRVALKVLLPGQDVDVGQRRRFVDEAIAMSRAAHPHVVHVYDLRVDGEHPYIAMELLEGEDLRALLRRVGSLAVSTAVDLLLPALDALAVAHELGIVHRDLKPANLFVAAARPEAALKVLDFGVARIRAPEFEARAEEKTRVTRRGTAMGSWRTMAPECFFDAALATDACDQFAMGVVLYACVAGRYPFQADSMRAQYEAIVSGRYTPLAGHGALDAALRRALDRDPAARFPSMRAFGAALVPFASDRVRLRWGASFPSAAAAHDAPAAAPPARLAPRWYFTAATFVLTLSSTFTFAVARWRRPPVRVSSDPPRGRVVQHAPAPAPSAPVAPSPAVRPAPPPSAAAPRARPRRAVIPPPAPQPPASEPPAAPAAAPPRLRCDDSGRCVVLGGA